MESKNCRLRNCSNNKAVVVVGACSSIGEVLVPELLKQYEHVILTESPQSFAQLVEKNYENQKSKNLQLLYVKKRRMNMKEIIFWVAIVTFWITFIAKKVREKKVRENRVAKMHK